MPSPTKRKPRKSKIDKLLEALREESRKIASGEVKTDDETLPESPSLSEGGVIAIFFKSRSKPKRAKPKPKRKKRKPAAKSHN